MLLNGALFVAILLTKREYVPSLAASERFRALSVRRLWFAMALTFFVIIAYLPSVSINFWVHDWTHRHIGAELTSWREVARLFVHPQVDGMYRPLAFLSFALDYRLFGVSLWGYHLQNIGLHLINTFLVWGLGRELGFERETSRLAAALFAVASIHFEAVLWPAARFDLLACVFSLVSLLLFIRSWKLEGKSSFCFGALSLAMFVVAVLNKETSYCLVLVAPALIFSHAEWKLPKLSPKKGIAFITALMSAAGILILIRLRLFHSLGGFGYDTHGSAISNVSLKSVYLLLANVTSLSPFAINSSQSSFILNAIVLLYAVVVVLFVWSLRSDGGRAKVILAGLAVLTALPALPVIGWIRPTLQHTRHLYLPSVWIALLIGAA